MVGQHKILLDISELVDNNKYPRFSIFVGKKGAGKKTLVRELSSLMNCEWVLCSNKIDDMRSISEMMYEQDKKTIYCIPDYEDMNFRARDSLLKVCEEPPNNSYIVLTSSTKEGILPTILSRGTVFEFSSYSRSELEEIAKKYNREDCTRLVDLCEVPGELGIANNTNIDEFENYVRIFFEKVGSSSAGNSLKVTNKISIRDDQDGYDIRLFLNYLFKLTSEMNDLEKKSRIFSEISLAKKDLQLKYNKQYIIDKLILNIRSIMNGTS